MLQVLNFRDPSPTETPNERFLYKVFGIMCVAREVSGVCVKRWVQMKEIVTHSAVGHQAPLVSVV